MLVTLAGVPLAGVVTGITVLGTGSGLSPVAATVPLVVPWRLLAGVRE